MFCDWLNVWQQHGDDLPDLLGGRVVSLTGRVTMGGAIVIDKVTGEQGEGFALMGDDMEVDYSTAKFVQHRGSFETNLHVRCVAGRVQVSGNPSSFGRLDNVFGLGVDDGIAVYNQVLEQLGLPAFTEGEVVKQWLQAEDRLQTSYSGAHITKIDLTENFSVGAGNVRAFNQWLMSQKVYRNAPGDDRLAQFARWNFESVYPSESKTWVQVKCYDKAQAIQDVTLPGYVKKLQAARKEGRLSTRDVERLVKEATDYLELLAGWCAEVGMVRGEWSYRSRWFKQKEAEGLGFWKPQQTQGQLMAEAQTEVDRVFGRAVVHQVDTDLGLTNSELGLLARWRRGEPLREAMPSSSFYRHRASILKVTGVDIAARPLLSARPELRPVYFHARPLSCQNAPIWYRAPQPCLRLAA
jgi:hypothetical protein